MQYFKKYIAPYFELSVWVTGLVWLAIINPAEKNHFSLCVFKWIGLPFCPGCGLGHSVSWLFHAELNQSLQAHPLGIFALCVLLYRIYILIKNSFSILPT